MTDDLQSMVEAREAGVAASQNLLRDEFKTAFSAGDNRFVSTPFFKSQRMSPVSVILFEDMDTQGTNSTDELMTVLGMLARGEYQIAHAACERLMNGLADRHAELHGEAGV